jgi:hypothetical protein
LLFFARTSPRAPLRAAPRRRPWCFRRLLSFWAGEAAKFGAPRNSETMLDVITHCSAP